MAVSRSSTVQCSCNHQYWYWNTLIDKFLSELCRPEQKYFIWNARSHNWKDRSCQSKKTATGFSLELNKWDKLTLDLLQNNRPSIGQDLWYLSRLIPSQLATEWRLQCAATLLWIKKRTYSDPFIRHLYFLGIHTRLYLV